MMSENREREEVSVNMAGMVVGKVLFLALVWAMFQTQMEFAYLIVVLLTLLAVSTHITNKKYS